MVPVMPYGRYKGEYISQLPTDYVQWLAKNLKSGWLKKAATIELQGRSAERKAKERAEGKAKAKRSLADFIKNGPKAPRSPATAF